MVDGRRVVALVPARGGSKGLPGKNLRLLGGKPLIGWSIDVARRCRLVDRVIVSTDDPAIAGLGKELGADVPFTRPLELATDKAKMYQVVLHAIEWGIGEYGHDGILLLLQPTSPLRTLEDVEGALQKLASPGVDAVVSVCEVDHHPLWSNTLPPDGCMADFLGPAALNSNRQDLPAYYRLNGAVYAGRFDYVRDCAGFLGPHTYAHIMPRRRSVDIDDELSLLVAQMIMDREGGSRS